jgi:hypothetical protein
MTFATGPGTTRTRAEGQGFGGGGVDDGFDGSENEYVGGKPGSAAWMELHVECETRGYREPI